MSISKYIDHTNIKKDATSDDIKKSCDECKEYNFRGLCVNPEWTGFIKKELENTSVKVVTLIDPPMGLSCKEERLAIVKKAIEDKTDDIDVVMNVVDLKYERYEKILKDLKAISRLAPTKVIISSGYLTYNEIEKASKIVKESGAMCVKTATEKDPLGNSELEEKAKHLKIMKENAPGLLVKASGGIKTFKNAIWMIESGADIIGTSGGVQIAQEASKFNL